MVEYLTKISWTKYAADINEQFANIDKQIQLLRTSIGNNTSGASKQEFIVFKNSIDTQIISITKQIQILRAATTQDYFDAKIQQIESSIEDQNTLYENRINDLIQTVRTLEYRLNNTVPNIFYRERQTYTITSPSEKICILLYTPIVRSEIVTLNGLELNFGLTNDYIISGTNIIINNNVNLTIDDVIIVKYDRT